MTYPEISSDGAATLLAAYELNYGSLAVALAKRGLGQTWPNPSVGAVLVASDGRRIVGCGFTAQGGRPHAEAIALAQAGNAARGATLFVTLEPCVHHGMTPPCSDALIEAGVAEVVYGVVDPDSRVAGEGLAQLERSRVRVRQGAFVDDARWLTLGHILRVTQDRPFVQVKLAVGSDGRVPAGDGAPVWVTCEESRVYAHLLRAQADAIAVGRGTVAADNPQLTCRLPGLFARSPIRVIFASRGDVPVTGKLFEDINSVPVWVVTGEKSNKDIEALHRAGAQLIQTPIMAGRLPIKPAMAKLAEAGLTRLFVEGGPTLARAFLDAGVADEIIIFRASKAAGAGGLLPFGDAGLEKLDTLSNFRLADVRRIAGDTVQTYRRTDF